MQRSVGMVVAMVVAVGSSGCGNPCGSGTVDQNGKCVASCGPGTALSGGKCVLAPDVCGAGTVLSEAQHACVSEAAAFDESPTPWSQNVRVSPSGVWAAEPSMAVDREGRLFVAAMYQADSAVSAVVATLDESDDGGKTWKTALSEQSKHDGGFTGDVSVAVDASDNVYFAYIDYASSSSQGQYPPGDIWVQVSDDHGQTFTGVKVNQDNGNYFCDRPWLAQGPNGEMVVSFTYQDNGSNASLYGFSVFDSTDQGADWQFLGDVEKTLYQQNIYTDGQFPTARSKNGYLIPRLTYENVMQGTPDMYLDVYRTTDFNNYDRARIAKIFYDPRTLTVDAMAVPAVAPNQNVYLAYLNAVSRNIDLSVVTSTDGGATFSPPVDVDRLPGAATEAMPWLSIDPSTGALNLIFIDNHTGEWMVVGARSTDGGKSFELTRVSDKTFVEDSSQTKWLGDFNAVAIGDGKTCAVWTDTRDGKSAIYLSCRQG